MFFLPYDAVEGKLGTGVTAVEEVESAGTPDSYSLSDAYPNPFNPETTIEFGLPTDGYVKVDVYNTAGQLVNSLVDKDLSAGAYKTTWDAMTEEGQQVSSGVYFYRMEAGEFHRHPFHDAAEVSLTFFTVSRYRGGFAESTPVVFLCLF